MDRSAGKDAARRDRERSCAGAMTVASLTKDLRRQLEKTVAEARRIGEEGAEQSLKRLAVEVSRPHDALTPEEKKFRVGLRAHARQLGDRLDTRPARLIQAVAYEHWHRLLFARFLIENDLLLHPEHGVALSLAELKELALGENREWVEVAAEYAQRMLLRRVFQPEDPVLRVSLPPEKRLQLEAQLNSLPRELFLAEDSLGWVYQFWQKDAKEAINRSEVKIGADQLAPVTQLFTEDYMVLFLLENTLGAWWAAHHAKPDLLGYSWTYLRLKENGTPAAGTFDGWPTRARELRVLDPCMGSGHFLTFALPILARMRVAEEGLSLSDAIVAALRDNLFGLELDPRCSQIAAFNLALTAWKLAGKHFEIPPLNIACSGLGINAKEEDWVKLAGADGRRQELMRWLYSLFSNAPVLGSLIDPSRVGRPMNEHEIARLLPLVERALAAEQATDDTKELAIAAQGLLAAARILSETFTLIVTNVPYLGRGKQVEVLKEYCENFHCNAKADLATCFVDRTIKAGVSRGTVALVTPQNWLFQHHYRHFRQALWHDHQWNFVARLGPGAFETISGEVVKASLLCVSRESFLPSHAFPAWDVSQESTPADKATALRRKPRELLQSAQLSSPDSRLVFDITEPGSCLGDYATALSGMSAGDSLRFDRVFWEVPNNGTDWAFVQTTVDEHQHYGGRSGIILWENERGQIYKLAQSVRHLNHAAQNWLRGKPNWGKQGVVVSQTGDLPVTLYQGDRYDLNCCAIVPNDPSHVPALWAYCSSPAFLSAVRNIDQALKVTPQTLLKVPFDLTEWKALAKEEYPKGLPKPFSSDPTQWLFNGHPKDSDHPLQVAVAWLVGYRWPRQTGSSFPDCPPLSAAGLEAYTHNDGIVCFVPLAGEEPAAEKFRSLLRAAYGAEYNFSQLLDGKKSATLEEWLRDEFFEEHCRIFHQRPFVWHVWDGRKDGFQALLNYHKLNHKTLEKLIYSSLGDWISRQRQDLKSGLEGADGRLAAAEHLQGELKKILDGEKPYDVFVRWKSLAEQPLGWNPDLNDGVRMNIRPWITETRLYRTTKRGILRVTPNIKYGKDRGKEPARDPKKFPWFKDTTDRNNDIHLALDEKRRARGLA
jgi:hypothetical protein